MGSTSLDVADMVFQSTVSIHHRIRMASNFKPARERSLSSVGSMSELRGEAEFSEINKKGTTKDIRYMLPQM